VSWSSSSSRKGLALCYAALQSSCKKIPTGPTEGPRVAVLVVRKHNFASSDFGTTNIAAWRGFLRGMKEFPNCVILDKTQGAEGVRIRVLLRTASYQKVRFVCLHSAILSSLLSLLTSSHSVAKQESSKPRLSFRRPATSVSVQQ
jgi:hypothetical protein